MRYLGRSSVASCLRIILNVLWYAGLVGIALFAIGFILAFIFGPPRMPADFTEHFTLETTFAKVEFTDVAFKNPKTALLPFFTVAIPFGILAIGIMMTIIFQLRKIFAALAEGNPFRRDNAKRIRIIAYLIIIAGIIQGIAGKLFGYFVVNNIVIQGAILTPKGTFDPGVMFTGLVILVLAEVFRQGAQLKEEQDLTI